MGDAAIRVEGAAELRRALKRAGLEAEDLKEVNNQVGQLVVTRAQQLAPKRSGVLAGSIRSARQQAGVVVRAGSASVPYANPIHWGWPKRHIRRNMFITRAVAQRWPEVIRAYERGMQALLGKVED